MASSAEPAVRDAERGDVAAICRFGEAHIRPHYAPLIGAEAADEQVRRWWNEAHLGAAVAGGLVVVAEADGQILGVGSAAAVELTMWSTSSMSTPGIAAVGWARSCLLPSPPSCPLTPIGCMSNISSPTSARVRSISVRASPWSGSNPAPRETLHTGSCGVSAIYPASCRRACHLSSV